MKHGCAHGGRRIGGDWGCLKVWGEKSKAQQNDRDHDQQAKTRYSHQLKLVCELRLRPGEICELRKAPNKALVSQEADPSNHGFV